MRRRCGESSCASTSTAASSAAERPGRARMAILRASSGRDHLLEPEHIVGRARGCSLCIEHKYVSGQHATLRWTGQHWALKDLGSRNGTFLDGVRLGSGDELPLRAGSKVAFGKLAAEQWELIDASPPSVMAVPLDGGE